MPPERSDFLVWISRWRFVRAVCFGIGVALLLAYLWTNGERYSFGDTGTNLADVGNATPQITAATLNNASSIILVANATKTITVSFTVTDDNGCGSVFYGGGVTTTLYRSGASSTCATVTPTFNYLYCYYTATTTNNCPGANSTTTTANATTTFDVWYFADATDGSSSYSGENWLAYVAVSDASTTYTTTTATGQELLTLLAITGTTSTINYGQVNPNANTSGTNQTYGIKNAGNSSTTLSLNGTAMTSAGNIISTSSQHYASNTFTYGGSEQQLQAVATAISGWTAIHAPLGTVWATTTPIFYLGTNAHDSFVSNGFVYVIGGLTSTVSYAPINTTGSIGAWATTTPYPSAIANPSALVSNGFVYVTGGATSTVRYAPLNATGSIGAWATTTPYPSTIAGQTSLISNGFIYVVGGSGPPATSTVRYAPLNATGSIGAWAATTPYPSAISNLAAFISNGFIYVVGGYINIVSTSTIMYAPINATGSIGAWAATTPYPSGIYSHTVFVSNGFVYVIGGNAGSFTSTVRFASLNASSGIGTWATTTAYPNGIGSASTFTLNGFVYVLGGYNGTYTSTVRYIELPSKNTYWGWSVPAGQAMGNYSSTVTFTAVYNP